MAARIKSAFFIMNTITTNSGGIMSRKNIFEITRKVIAAALLFSLLIISQAGCGNKEPVIGTDECLDTACEIAIYGFNRNEAEETIAEGFKVIEESEALLSKTVKGSDVDRINSAAGEEVEISETTRETIAVGLEMGEISGGSFDITIGRLTDLWDFKASDPQVPSANEIGKACETVDYRQVELAGNNISLRNIRAKIDLGGIAKGYIADQLTEFLEDKGVESGIINLGGNVVAIGTKEGGDDFVIGIERPYSDRTEVIGTVSVQDKTVVTSGIYERMFERDGTIYHHILDPSTGYPSETDLESVTIVAEKGNSCFCDGLSTTCLMAGSNEAMRIVKMLQKKYPEKNIEALFIDRKDNITVTDGMKLNPVE